MTAINQKADQILKWRTEVDQWIIDDWRKANPKHPYVALRDQFDSTLIDSTSLPEKPKSLKKSASPKIPSVLTVTAKVLSPDDLALKVHVLTLNFDRKFKALEILPDIRKFAVLNADDKKAVAAITTILSKRGHLFQKFDREFKADHVKFKAIPKT